MLIFFLILIQANTLVNDTNVMTMSTDSLDNEKDLALARDPDLSDLGDNEWERTKWLKPEGKF